MGVLESRTPMTIPFRITEDDYRALVTSVGSMAALVGVVGREPRDLLGYAGKAVLSELSPYLERSVKISQWPGTRSIAPARVEYFRSEPGAVDVITRCTGSFWEWMDPEMPEDLHFLREDGTVVLGSTTCERYAWLELDREERDSLAVPPSLRLRLGQFDPLDEVAAWVAAYGEDLAWAGRVEFEDGSTGSRSASSVRVVDGVRMAGLQVTAAGEFTSTFVVAGEPETSRVTVGDSPELERLLAAFVDGLSRLAT
ncbi:hypothetical protein [Propionicimonas sp.]|nr:hypothetical protein [Propionicimonas sp.]MBA3020538.1 hypothetical protein [Propionicimonas sp.]MBU4409488.1 hypothetical protein [Actinomycetota bacterium]